MKVQPAQAPVLRPFKDLCGKHRVSKTEAAALRVVLELSAGSMISEEDFVKGREAWLSAPAGRK